MADSIHEQGAKVFVELAEGGVHSRSRSATGVWNPTLGVSQVPSVVLNDIPQVLDVSTMRAIQGSYAAASANLKTAGIDGATLHAAHSYLLGQFLSPAYNFRKDEYGGTAGNRVRFLIETGEQIRDRVGADFALGVRLSYDEYIGEAGITPSLSDEYVDLLVQTGLFDYFDISTGGYHSGERFVPPNVLPDVHIASYAKRAREIVAGRAKIIMAHRVRTIDLAERMLSEGVTDLVGMTRAHMADPYLITKAKEGRFQEIQRCVGTNECVYNSHMRFNHSCTVNPVNGREAQWGSGTLDEVTQPRRIAVIGGGPAGLRFAATAARRGHDVELFERTSRLGGHINDLAAVPYHGTWSELIDDLTTAAQVAGATLRTGVDADVQTVQTGGFDEAVVATGCTWDSTGLSPARPGASVPGLDSHPHVLTLPQAFAALNEDAKAIRGRVLIMDETGAYVPLGLAERLLEEGTAVTVISRRNTIGEIPRETWEFPLFMQRTKDLPLSLLANTLIDRVEGSTVWLSSIWGGSVSSDSYDSIIVSGLRFSNDELAYRLREAGIQTHVIGDARAPRRTADAVYEGEKLARRI